MKPFIPSLSCMALMAVVLPGLVSISYADDAIDKAIKARRGAMQLYNHYAGPLFGMAKGDIAYDASMAALLAENLNAVVNLSQSRMWPPGSHKGARKGTRTRQSLWESGSDISEKAQAMRDAALELTLVAGDGLDSLRGGIRGIGQSCKGCHDDYRDENF